LPAQSRLGSQTRGSLGGIMGATLQTPRSAGFFRATVVAVALAAFVPAVTTACFGRFALIRKVHRFHKEVDQDKWIQWFVFLVLNVTSVYSLAALIDALFANSMEFWTGENPILSDAGTMREVRGPDGALARATFRPDGRIRLLVIGSNGDRHDLVLTRESHSVSARDLEGRFLARVADVNGQPRLIPAAAR